MHSCFLNILTFILVCTSLVWTASAMNWTYDSYMEARRELMQQERNGRFDVESMNLTTKELVVNASLMALKSREVQASLDYFPPTMDFPDAQPLIDKSLVFQFLKRFPKGGILHTHSGSSVSFHTLIKQGTYDDNCYIYLNPNAPTFAPGTYIPLYIDALRNNVPPPYANGSIGFFRISPSPEWHSINDIRASYSFPGAFDQALYDSLMLGDGPFVNGIDAWKRMDLLFQRVGMFLSYKPVVELVVNGFVENLMADNMIYAEIRQMFGFMYDLEHGTYSAQEEIEYLESLVSKYRQQYPTFVGLKMIFCGVRSSNKTSVFSGMLEAIQLRKQFPDLISGYDLVGEEHAGHTTLYFLSDFLQYAQRENVTHVNLPFYFHGGESDWYFNENLFDVILLGTRRIGHGYALAKHPLLMNLVKERDICVEVCPVSNQMLRLLSDIRNHPAATFITEGVPFVLSYDDPAMYNYVSLAYDFWEGFMSWDMDLASLKQLAWNSIVYSALEGEEREQALRIYSNLYDQFIENEYARVVNGTFMH